MIGSKRCRPVRDIGTPPFGSDHRLLPSSSTQSTPIQNSQITKISQRPTKRVTLCPPRSSVSSVSPSHHHQQRHGQAQERSNAGPHVSSEGDIQPENDNVVEEREEADSLNEVVMCVDMRDRGTVGCCYYVARDQKLCVMADVAYGGVEVIEICRLYHKSMSRLCC